MKAGRSVSILVLAWALAGCSGLFKRDIAVDQFYLLRAAPAQATTVQANAPSLRIGRTLAAPGLDADRLVLVRSDHRMDYYAASRWVAPVPQMVEDLAAETLRNSGAWASVHDSQGAFPTDYFLQIDIRRFEADYTASTEPRVHVVLDCTLGRRTDRERLSHFLAEASAPAGADRMSAVVAAFETATQAALATIAERSAQLLASVPAK